MSDAITIRRREPEDYPSFCRLFQQPRVIHGTLQMPYPSEDMWRQRLQSGASDDHYQLVAVVDGEVVGCAGLHPEQRPRRRHAASIGMAVHDGWQGQGVGRALMCALLDVADNWLQLRRVELTVFADNAHAIALYESVGFLKEGRLAGYAFRDGEYVDAWAMARQR